MNEKDKVFNELAFDAPTQIITAPPNLYFEIEDDGDKWYSPIVCIALTKGHEVFFYGY